MEAAATGLPLLATNIRGCRQVVDDRVNGRLVAPRDAQALADAVRELARDDEARSAMGKASIAKAHREFDQHTQIEITLDTYERLLRARSATPR
jgi:glycosyltransferase involved in cell wall biosynthesis